MAQQLRMPSLGQTTDELRIVAWLKAEGDAVKLGEPILEVETDKAVLQVESSFGGVLLRVLRQVDEVVLAGEIIATIGQHGDAVDSSAPVLHPTAAAPTPVAGLPTAPNADNQQLLATPIARKLAKDQGIDLKRVKGSGPGGRIEKKDVEALIGTQAATPNAMPAPVESDVAVPRHRLVIAQRLTRSVQTIPQITLNRAADMRSAQALVAAQRTRGLTALKVTHVLLRSVARALRAHPHMNRLWRNDGPAYRQLRQCNVSLAVASDENLLVATLTEPDQLELAQLVRLTDEAVARARQGALIQADTAPSAITISNLGMHSVESFRPSSTQINP